MSRLEAVTCREVIEPALALAKWAFDSQVVIGPGRVNLTGERMYDESQKIIADYVLRLWNMPLAVLEAKAEGEDAADGVQQGSRYARRLGIRFSVATNGSTWILTDNDSQEHEHLTGPPTPGDILHRMGRNTIPQEWYATERWVDVWRDAGSPLDFRWLTANRRLPPSDKRGDHCQILRLATGTDRAERVTAHLTKGTFVLLEHIVNLGNLRNHRGASAASPPTITAAVAFCFTVLELIAALDRDLAGKPAGVA